MRHLVPVPGYKGGVKPVPMEEREAGPRAEAPAHKVGVRASFVANEADGSHTHSRPLRGKAGFATDEDDATRSEKPRRLSMPKAVTNLMFSKTSKQSRARSEYTITFGGDGGTKGSAHRRLRAVFSAARLASPYTSWQAHSTFNLSLAQKKLLQLKYHDNAVMYLSNRDRMTIEWDEVPGVIEAGSVNLVEYPKMELRDAADNAMRRFSMPEQSGQRLEQSPARRRQRSRQPGPEAEAVLAELILRLVTQHFDKIETVDDISGAKLVHCLLLANTDESVALAVRLFEARPRLLLGVHAGKGDHRTGAIFEGEGSLHILAVNRRTSPLVRLLRLASNSLSTEDFKRLLSQRVEGPFFEGEPMCSFGATPVSYMACFGQREPLQVLFGQDPSLSSGLVDDEFRDQLLHSPAAKGGKFGFYPLHAVVACDLPDMFDFLVNSCGAVAERDLSDGDVVVDVVRDGEGLTPLQLSAKLGAYIHSASSGAAIRTLCFRTFTLPSRPRLAQASRRCSNTSSSSAQSASGSGDRSRST